MKLRVVILFIFSLSFVFRSVAQEKSDYTQSRILFLLDESSSMLQTWSTGKEKYKIANEIINRLMDSVNAVNSDVQFSLRVFGNQHTVPEHDCHDTKSEVPFSPDNKAQMSFRLDDLHPLGVTAIAYSLSEAADKDLIDEAHNAYSIILITDGGESCNGDICGVMDKLIRNKVFFKPYVLSLEDLPELKSEYACLGNYLPVTKRSDITKAVTTIVDAFRPMLKMTKVDYQKMQVIASKAPSALKVNMPAVKAEVPVVEPPKPKPVDTVVVPVKKSAIEVNEEPKRPAPVKMSLAKRPKWRNMFVAPPVLKAPPLVTIIPLSIKVSEDDVAIPHAAPVKLVVANMPRLKRLPVAKASLTSLTTVNVIVPDIKIELPVIRPAAITMVMAKMPKLKKLPLTKTSFPGFTTMAVTVPVINVEIPVDRPAPVKLARVQPGKMRRFAVQKAAPFVAAKFPPVQFTMDVDPADIAPARPASFKMQSVKITGLKKFNTSLPALTPLKKLKVVTPDFKVEIPEPEKPVVVTPPTPPPPPVVARTQLKLPKAKRGNFRMHLLYVNTFLDSDLKPVKVPPPPVFKYTEPPPVPPKPATPVKPKPGKPVTTSTPPATPKTGEYTVEHTDAQETTLEVYLTNGRGKFYSTTPRVVLFDPKNNNKELKRFFRTVDEAGNPDPQTNLPIGPLDLTIVGRDDLLAHVDIQQNKHNKVFVKVNNFTLFFRYDGAPDRPVKEFTATVTQRNVNNGKMIEQKCSDRKEYEPGNYHIVVHSFPEEVFNADLDDFSRGLTIAQPGFVKFTSEVNTNTIGLYKELGDKFLQFATLNLSDPKTQHLQIQPGKYQVHYNNGQTKFAAPERVITFIVKSTQEAEVVLVK